MFPLFGPELESPRSVPKSLARPLGPPGLTRVSLQAPASRTPGGGRPHNPRLQGCNKENEAQLKGGALSGALLTPASPQRSFSVASVASTYSEFVVINPVSSASASLVSVRQISGAHWERKAAFTSQSESVQSRCTPPRLKQPAAPV